MAERDVPTVWVSQTTRSLARMLAKEASICVLRVRDGSVSQRPRADPVEDK